MPKRFMDLLDTLPAGWIGYRGSIDWAPHSCDLIPIDFSIWGMMKDRVFRGKLRTLAQLQASITSQFEQINTNRLLCHKICNSVLTQMEKYVTQEGLQFKQF